jgi:hypothetical protein
MPSRAADYEGSGSDGAVQQGVEADEAEHNGASQLNSSVRQLLGDRPGVLLVVSSAIPWLRRQGW